MSIKVNVITKGFLPRLATKNSACVDLQANFDEVNVKDLKGQNFIVSNDNGIVKSVVLNPGGRVLIPTGLFIEVPEGYEAQIRPRSGLAINNGVSIVNTPGTIDSKHNYQ